MRAVVSPTVLEAMHDAARDEDDGAGAGRRGLVTDVIS